MKKINNKGFVISSILYTLLISFLLMLALLLLQFKSSSDVINNASKDLVNGEELKLYHVHVGSGTCKKISDTFGEIIFNHDGSNKFSVSSSDYNWFSSSMIIKINSRYGVYYWPKDFSGAKISYTGVDENGLSLYLLTVGTSPVDNIDLTFDDNGVVMRSCGSYCDGTPYGKISASVTDKILSTTDEITFDPEDGCED